MYRQVFLLGTLALFSFRCGKSSSRDTVEAPPSAPTAGNMTSSSEVSMAVVASNLDESSSAVGSGDLSSDVAASAALNLAGTITRTRACTVDTTDLSAVVQLTYSGNESRVTGKATISDTATGTETRVWTNTVSKAQMQCGPHKKYVKVDWKSVSDVNGLKLVDTTAKTDTLVTVFTHPKTGTRTLTKAESGTRTVEWSVPSTATDVSTLTKTISVDVTRTSLLTKVDGSQVDLSGTHATLASDPLVITKVTDLTTGYPTSFTISSGTMTVTKVGKYYITNVYSNVVYSMSASNPCVPTSGTITSSFYNAATDATPLATKTITFSSTGPTVTGDTTATDDFVNSVNYNCHLVQGT